MTEATITINLWEAQTLAWMASMKFRENAKKVHEETMHAREAHLAEFENLFERLSDVAGVLKEAKAQ